ncbi:MAG TPA: hypothetical protein PKC96_05380 [Bacilli bacterium]|nr:hypothetical protein [Bacilli bacterium]
MNVIDAVSETLGYIFDEKIPYAHALKRVQDAHPSGHEDLQFVRSLTSCTLHHYLAIEDLLTRLDSGFSTTKDMLYIYATIVSDLHFFRRLGIQRLLLELNEIKAKKEFAVSPEVESKIFAIAENEEEFIDSTDMDSPEYLSLKYNNPLWLTKMWMKHLGLEVTRRYLNANTHSVAQSLRVNPLVNTQSAILNENPDFSAGPASDTLVYRHHERIQSHPLFVNHTIFQQRFALSEVINALPIQRIRDCLIYEERPHAVYLDLSLRSKTEMKIDMAVPSDKRRYDVEGALKSWNLPNVHVFESKANSLITAIRDEKDLVVVLPDCSKFDLIRTIPDFLYHFDQSALDNYIFSEATALREASAFVKPDGLLLYIINTCSNKEGHALIIEFLKNNVQFDLLSEKQYLPIDRFNSTLYYALLKRKDKEK